MIGPVAASAIRAALVVGGEIARGAVAKARAKRQAKREEAPRPLTCPECGAVVERG